MKLKIFQVDAFTSELFKGNPAAVIPLKKWLPAELMQQIGMENNLSDTGFFIPSDKKGVDFDIRWFTPALEINLCGHATLGAAYVIMNQIKKKWKSVTFSSQSGLLHARKKKGIIEMDFPSWLPEKQNEFPELLGVSLGNPEIFGVYKNRDYLVELKDEEAVVNCKPDFALMKRTGEKIIITARGNDVDFVSRFFAPSAGIDEDPVTGSAHSQLVPFWSQKLGKKKMKARQLSARGGELSCEQKAERVILGGECVFYMEGQIRI